MRLHYVRPSGNKEFGYDSTEIEQVITEAEKAAAATAARDCPFCGAAPEVYISWMYGFSGGLSIRCTNCKVSTANYPIGKMITGNIYTVGDRVNQAARIWNRRQD